MHSIYVSAAHGTSVFLILRWLKIKGEQNCRGIRVPVTMTETRVYNIYIGHCSFSLNFLSFTQFCVLF